MAGDSMNTDAVAFEEIKGWCRDHSLGDESLLIAELLLENLKPNDGAVHVHVFVDMSDLGYGEFIGNVTVINSENISDCCIIPVYMRTPMTYPVQYHPFLQFLMNRFPLFRMILSNRLLPI